MPLFFVIVLQPCEPGAGDAAEHGEDQEEEGRADRQGGREQQIVLACFLPPVRGAGATDSSRLLPTSCQGGREQQIVLACFQPPVRRDGSNR